MEKKLFQLRALITYLGYVLREPAFLKKKLLTGSNISFNFEFLAVSIDPEKISVLGFSRIYEERPNSNCIDSGYKSRVFVYQVLLCSFKYDLDHGRPSNQAHTGNLPCNTPITLCWEGRVHASVL